MDLLFTIDARYARVTSQVFSEHPKLCAIETIGIELFAKKAFCSKVYQGDVVEIFRVEAVLGILVAQ